MINIEELREWFEDNFEELKFETGRSITSNMKEFAWQQVKLYYRKLLYIAENITETEVKLILPDQKTPKGRKYTIEGVVDIVQDGEKTTMYDIKTHNCDDVIANSELYKGQLNVYAHIWENLRNTTVDNMAIIATAPSNEIKEAFINGDEELEILLNEWNPVVELDFDKNEVENQIKSFGETVDKIEEGKFSAPPIEKLMKIRKGQKAPFGTAICRHCDARFSCKSYKIYTKRKDNIESKEILEEIELENEEWKETIILK